MTALALACRAGLEGAVESLIKHTPAEDVERVHTDQQGMTPLMHAAAAGHTEVVRCLLGLQAFGPLVRDAAGRTAMDHAESQGYTEIAVMLVCFVTLGQWLARKMAF